MEAFSKYSPAQIKEICVICLSKTSDLNLISESNISDKLRDCTSIQVPSDKALICNGCTNEINRLYAFKQKVAVAFDVYKELVQQPVIESNHTSQTEKNQETIEKTPDSESRPTDPVDNLKISKNDLDDSGIVQEGQNESTKQSSNNICTTINENKENILEKTVRIYRNKKIIKNNVAKVSANNNVQLKLLQDLATRIGKNAEDESYKCKTCGNCFFEKAKMNKHVCRRSQLNYKCHLCKISFSKKSLLEKHLEQRLCARRIQKLKKSIQNVVTCRTKYLVAAALQSAKNLDQKEDSSDSASVAYSDVSSSPCRSTSIDGFDIDGLFDKNLSPVTG